MTQGADAKLVNDNIHVCYEQYGKWNGREKRNTRWVNHI